MTERTRGADGDARLRAAVAVALALPVVVATALLSDAGGMLLLTPDELAAIAWVGQGAVWSHLLEKRLEHDHE